MDIENLKRDITRLKSFISGHIDRGDLCGADERVIAAVESMACGVPCNIQCRGVLGCALWHDGYQIPLRTDCGVGANEVVDAVIVRLPSEITPPTEPT